MYMGGNGLFGVVSVDPDRPHVLEVRRWGTGWPFEMPPAERHHSMTGEPGGTWRNRGRGPHTLVGLGTAGAGFDRGSPYRRGPDADDPRAAFIFEGIEDELIGDEPNLQVRWGAAGYEFDRVDAELGSPASTLRLASSVRFNASHRSMVDDEMYFTQGRDGAHVGDPQVPGAPHRFARADMAYLEYPNGGAVFSAGSICWRGSLSAHDYGGTVSRVTENVLRRFADPDWRRSRGVTPDRGHRRSRRSGRPSRDDPAGHACEPRVARLASGAIVLSHRVGTTREGGDGRPRLVRSDDGGATWRELASPFDGALPAGWDLRGCALAELGGRRAARGRRRHRQDVRQAAVQPGDGGARPGPRTSSHGRTTAARRGPSPGTWPTAGTSSTPARVSWHSPTAASCARSRRSRPTTTRRVWRYTGGVAPLRRRRPDLGRAGDLGGIGPRRRPARHDVVGPADRAAGVRRARPVLLRLPPRDADGGPGPHRVEPGRRRDLERTHLDRAARPGDLSPAPPRRPAARLPAAPRRDRRRWSRSSRTTAAEPSIASRETRRLRARRRHRRRAPTAR